MIRLGLTIRGKIVIITSAILLAVSIYWFTTPRELYIITSIILIMLILSDWIVTRGLLITLDRLRIERIYDEKIYDGEEVDIKISISNDGASGLYGVYIEDRYPDTLKLVDGYNHGVVNIPPKSRIEFTYRLRGEAVGRHVFGETILRIVEPLGFYEINAIYNRDKADAIRCMPSIPRVDLREYSKRGYRLFVGSWYAKYHGYSMEYKDIREYHPGDEYRKIDWKATARTGKLMIREYEAEAENNIVLVLDLSRNMFIGELGIRKYDYACRTISFIVNYCIDTRDRIGLVLLSRSYPRIIRMATATPRLFTDILDTLSSINIYPPREDDLTGFDLSRIIKLLGIRDKTLFIFISDLEDEDRARIIIDGVKTIRAMRHEVIFISPLTVLFEARILEGLDAAVYRTIGYQVSLIHRRIVGELSKYGIPVITVGPEDLIPVILMKMEEYRRVIAT